MEREIMLLRANEIANPYGLTAFFLEGIVSVGVQGDQRTLTPVIVLTGPFPGHEVLAQVSTAISNAIPVNRVTYEFPPEPV